MPVSINSGIISTRSGYLATKLIAIAEAFRSQSAWSCKKAGKSDITVLTHSGRVVAVNSSEYFMPRKVSYLDAWRNPFKFCLPVMTGGLSYPFAEPPQDGARLLGFSWR